MTEKSTAFMPAVIEISKNPSPKPQMRVRLLNDAERGPQMLHHRVSTKEQPTQDN